MDNVAFFVNEILQVLKKSKHKFMSIDKVTEFVKESMRDSYTVEVGMAVRDAVIEHDKIDFFKEGDYINEQKFYYCTGNWIALKGVYKNPVEAKEKLGWYSWQDSDEVDWSKV
jgi:hypothetical protein